MKILINNKFENYIKPIYNDNGKISFKTGDEIKFSKKIKYIVPGFIDQHIHGLKGADTMDASFESLNKQSLGLLEEGVTTFLPTTMTASFEKINEVLDCIKQNKDKVHGANIFGVHLEGPFISSEKIGAQNPKYLAKLTIENLEKIKNLDLVKIVTYAPELDNQNLTFTKYLKQHNIIPSVGHSHASCEEVMLAAKEGLCLFTHLHNAMSGYKNREPGVVTAAYNLENTYKEIIVDGYHVDPYTLNSVYKNIGTNHINLITDAMCAKGLEDGIYDFGGQNVLKSKDKVVLEGTDTLAGSVLKMNDSIKNMIDMTDCKIEEAFQMASYNQAQLLNIKNKGLIIDGFDFDITCLDEDLNVLEVYIKGEKLYDKS